MESWLPWLTDREHLLTDLLPDDALVLLVEPKRMRDRAQELLDEEAALAGTLAGTWGAGGEHDLPRLSLDVRPAARAHRAGAVSLLATPDHPDTPRVAASAFDPVVGDTDALARRLRALAGDGLPRRARRRRRGFRAAVCATSSPARALDAGPASPRPARCGCVVAPLERGVVLPGAQLALVAEADLTGRRRVHRRARVARAEGTTTTTRSSPGDYVVHHQHGVGRYLEMKPLTMGGVERDYLWLEFRDGKVYVPTDQVGFVRKYTGGETPVAQPHGRRRLREAARPGAQRGARDRRGARRALPAAAGDARAARSVPTRRGSTRWRRRSPTRRRPTSCRRSST